MNDTKKKGFMVIISGPSGSGKGTVVKEIFDISDNFAYSVSATSRQPREGEVDGKDYYFVSREKFEDMIDKGEMLEYNYYCENYYGSPKEHVYKELDRGRNVLLEIDVNGAMQIKEKYPEDTVLIMLIPPDAETIERRLRSRGTETDEVIAKRLERAKEELLFADRYDYLVVNRDGMIRECAESIIDIINVIQEYSTSRNAEIINDFFEKR